MNMTIIQFLRFICDTINRAKRKGGHLELH